MKTRRPVGWHEETENQGTASQRSEASMSDKVSGSRWGRLFRMGWLGRHALPFARKRSLAKHADAAEEMFRALGSMKGLALKIGQMAGYLDGVLPEELREPYQQVLARLQAQAPALPFSAIAAVLAAELGTDWRGRFVEIDESPLAAASIGQVHRARLPGGEEVAVKVQYPGVDRALAADFKNAKLLGMLNTMMMGVAGAGGVARSFDDTLAEVRARMLEELDYQREARMQERFAQLFADDPDIRIPRVIAACSTRRVITTTFERGQTFAEVCSEATQAERNRYAGILTRAVFRSIYEFRLFNADPHPGNYLFSGGQVVLLDYGCVKEIPDWMATAMIRYVRAALRGDWPEFDAAIADAFRMDVSKHDAFSVVRDFILYCLEPFLSDQPFAFDARYTGRSVTLMLDGVRRLKLRDLPAPPGDFAFISRLQWGFYSVLTQLRATQRWRDHLPPVVTSIDPQPGAHRRSEIA
jgi:predicted unusual protein kinase regulating ubiquinone biosynthesis (AarF/ABC1/UbiB family)